MKKLISSLMVLAVVVLLVVSCNNGGKSSSVDYVKPAWAVQGVYPIAVHGENGDLIGYLAGVDNVDGCITIYNPDMDKFFKMSTDTGTIRGWRFGKTYRNCADENCNFYTYKRFSKFIYVNDVNTDWPRVSSGKFATVSDNPADAKSPSELKY